MDFIARINLKEYDHFCPIPNLLSVNNMNGSVFFFSIIHLAISINMYVTQARI